jgi:hypothetical protein
MAILAGYGLSLIEHVLPHVPSRRNMLGISRMSLCDLNIINESPSSRPSSWPDLIRPSTGPALGIDRVDTRLKAGHDDGREVTRLFCDEPNNRFKEWVRVGTGVSLRG